MTQTQSQVSMKRWLLLSLLLHLLLMLLFIDIEYDHALMESLLNPSESPAQQAAYQPPPVALAQQQSALSQDPDELDFKLNLKENSHFGATVIFQDEPELGDSPNESTGETSAAIPEQEILESSLPEASSDELSTEQESDDTTQDVPQPDIASDSPPTTEQHPATRLVDGQDIVPISPAQLPKKPRRSFREKVTHKKAASPMTHNLTLQKLAEGFLNYVKDNKNQAVDINTQELRYVGYMQKIGWFLQNSFHLHNRPITLEENIRVQTNLHLEIDEAGSLLNVTLAPSTDVQQMDDILLKIVKNAAPFPPLPKHLQRKSIKIKLPIAVDAARGTHTYYFTFRG